MDAYQDYFHLKSFQFPQFKIEPDSLAPTYAINLLTGENISLSHRQGKVYKIELDDGQSFAGKLNGKPFEQDLKDFILDNFI